jgi:hypothetical protein
MSREELVRLQRELREAEAELADREAELIDLRVELSAFQLEYDTRVGRKAAELDEIEAEIARLNKWIGEYRQWGPSGPPRTRGGEPYVSVEEQYRRTWREPHEEPLDLHTWFDRAGKTPPVTEARIKRLYRQLCRRFHPDLTQDPEERAWRTERMAAINAAYAGRTRDSRRALADLQALADQPDYVRVRALNDERAGAPSLPALRERLSRVRRRLGQIEREMRALIDGPAMQMSLQIKLARQRGQDMLSAMAADVERDLVRKRAELGFLRAQLKRLGLEL